MKTVGQWFLKLLGRQAFFGHDPYDFDLWRSNLKINKGQLLVMTNLHAMPWTSELVPVYPPYNFVVCGY
jgi:hypothetical protein